MRGFGYALRGLLASKAAIVIAVRKVIWPIFSTRWLHGSLKIWHL